MKRITTLFAAIGALALAPAHAATFTFNFTYDGTDLTLDAGSDTPGGTVLDIGDSFTITVTAAGDAFFNVLTNYEDFVPLSFATTDGATRSATINTELFMDGSSVFTASESAAQSSFHVGAQDFEFDAGLMFDTLVLDWTFDGISDPLVDTILATVPGFFSQFGDSESPFFNASEIAFVTGGDPVPLPGAALLFASAGIFGARAMRRRRTA